jgi:hypothetical protein
VEQSAAEFKSGGCDYAAPAGKSVALRKKGQPVGSGIIEL